MTVQKALTAGLFMNAVQLSETTADLQNPASSGINIYKMLRSTGPGRRRGVPCSCETWVTVCETAAAGTPCLVHLPIASNVNATRK